jgi:hypothetical protein
MVNPNSISILEVRANWSRVVAFAWMYPEVLADLRKNPKQTITDLAMGGQYKNLITIDSETQDAANIIKTQTDTDPEEPYRGYLPIPDAVGGLEKATPANLAALLKSGITGILKFDNQAELWADELLAAWEDPKQLKNVRQDPLQHLHHRDQLLETTYGVLPVPDRPKTLEDKDLGELTNFLKGDIMTHLGGIFLFGS